MSARAFLVGLAIGSMAAMTPACGTTTKRCLRSNCAGCCDANDECQLGTQAFACGTDGRMCSTCQMGQTCGNGVCVGGAGGGAAMDGGGTGGGAAGGMPLCANCNGCCDTNGACRGGNTATACGFSGRACQNCQAQGQACSTMGTCITFTCPGCVLDGGQCAPGNSNLACGSDAGVCLQCGTNQNCFNGQCVTAATCGPANCNGCCDGNLCVTVPSAAKCGSGGNACSACSGAQQCQAGSCVSGAGGGSAGGSASGGGAGGGSTTSCTLCIQGCCDAQGVCQMGESRTVCGSAGEACRSCSGISGCLPVPLIPIGGFCGP
jgi:hypothetical protein